MKNKLKKDENITKSYTKTALQYCNDITSGKIPAGPYVVLACQRHLDDLERAKTKDFPYRFDEAKAERRCAFSETLHHVKGKWAGQLLKLEPFQVFMRSCVWGWVKKSDGYRRFNTVFILEPRKNGKSITGADTGLYMLAADGEKGSEVYSGATSEKQALEVFRPAWMMANKNKDLREHFHLSLSGNPRNPTSIYRLSDMSRFEPLIGKPGFGSSPHCAIIDEYHEHKTSEQFDNMNTGMGAREQPMMFVITTAGTDTSSPCYDLYLRAIKILEKTIEDETFFGIMYGIGKEDDFKDFEVWKKANPNYGVSINKDYLHRKYTEVITDASKQNINLCMHLDQWMNAGVAWMNMVKWEACKDETLKIEDFKGQNCIAAFDLASKIDISSLGLIFEHQRIIDNELVNGYAYFAKHYLPEETVQLAGNEHYDKWVKEGYITQTPGARTDFLYIENDLKEINAEYPISELAFDPKEATYLVNNVMEWLGPERCIEITQGPALMSEPMKETEGLIYDNKLWHTDDPVLNWMMGNVVQRRGRNTGPVKYYYPTKQKNENKIDAVVCLIMAIGRAILHHEDSMFEGMTKEQILKNVAF